MKTVEAHASASACPFDPSTLIGVCRTIAKTFNASFPAHILNNDDFVQIGLIGALSVPAMPDKSAADMERIRIRAARREMIDAMRYFHDFKSPTGRRLEFLSDDLVRLAESRQGVSRPEKAWACLLDLEAVAARLSPCERAILLGRVQGMTGEELATQLSLTPNQFYYVQRRLRGAHAEGLEDIELAWVRRVNLPRKKKTEQRGGRAPARA